jgi:hypothetical protein
MLIENYAWQSPTFAMKKHKPTGLNTLSTLKLERSNVITLQSQCQLHLPITTRLFPEARLKMKSNPHQVIARPT